MKKGDYWATPQPLFDALDKEFWFQLDAAANYDNAKCGSYFNEEDNSLAQTWFGYENVWLNPPYSRNKIGPFMKKAYEESMNGATVVCLVRFDPSAKWFQNFVHGKASNVRMLKRRVKFEGADSLYPFPCCVVVYRPPNDNGITTQVTNYTLWGW
jgi:site-specific DNA-methyltransferase (adenine-specific)